MSSRGAKATNGHVTTTEYKMKTEDSYIHDAKVIVGTSSSQHGLPDYSHTPHRKYIKENSDGSFREMRIYGDKGQPLLEIGYHGERPLTGDRNTKVLHYHVLTVISTTDIIRSPAVRLHKNSKMYKQYQKYLKEYGL